MARNPRLHKIWFDKITSGTVPKSILAYVSNIFIHSDFWKRIFKWIFLEFFLKNVYNLSTFKLGHCKKNHYVHNYFCIIFIYITIQFFHLAQGVFGKLEWKNYLLIFVYYSSLFEKTLEKITLNIWPSPTSDFNKYGNVKYKKLKKSQEIFLKPGNIK